MPVCFVRGTRVLTMKGEVPIEALRVGDFVVTLDPGPQPIRWISSSIHPAYDSFAPVEIAKGAYGARRPLRLSQNHRVLLGGKALDLCFGTDKALCAVGFLTEGRLVTVREGGSVEYFHLLLPNHEVIFADGVACGSFFPGEMGRAALDKSARLDLHRLLEAEAGPRALAYLDLRRTEARLLMDQHYEEFNSVRPRTAPPPRTTAADKVAAAPFLQTA